MVFLSLISLSVLSATINYASSCGSLGWETREYSDWEKNWCRQDFNRCARHLCNVNGHSCDNYLIKNTIIPELRCKLLSQCQPRTDKLGQSCTWNSDCGNSNYRCQRNRCVYKSTVSVSYPSGNNRRCDRWDSECNDKSMRCDRKKGLCVPKSGGSGDKDGMDCDATPDCARDYTCINFRCVYTAGRGITLAGSAGSGGAGSRKRCDRWDSECQDSRLRCDRKRGECVSKYNSKNGKPYRQGKSCRFSPDCGPDYRCINGDCVLGDLA